MRHEDQEPKVDSRMWTEAPINGSLPRHMPHQCVSRVPGFHPNGLYAKPCQPLTYSKFGALGASAASSYEIPTPLRRHWPCSSIVCRVTCDRMSCMDGYPFTQSVQGVHGYWARHVLMISRGEAWAICFQPRPQPGLNTLA